MAVLVLCSVLLGPGLILTTDPVAATNNTTTTPSEPTYEREDGVRYCSELNGFEQALVTFGFGQCTDDVEVIEGNAEETHHSIYNHAIIVNSKMNREQVEDESFARFAESEMRIAAKKEIVQSLNEGESLQQAKADATAEINGVASEMQKSAWADQNERVSHLRSWNQTISETEQLGRNDVFAFNYGNSKFGTQNVTTWDGETIEVQKFIYLDGDCSQGYCDANDRYTYYDGSVWNGEHEDAIIRPPSSLDSGQVTVLDPTAEKQKINKINNSRTKVIDNSDEIAEAIYRNYEPGEITVEDVMSASEMASAYGSGDGTGHYAWAGLFAAQRGYASPVGHSMTIEYSESISNEFYVGTTQNGQPTDYRLAQGVTEDVSGDVTYTVYGDPADNGTQIDFSIVNGAGSKSATLNQNGVATVSFDASSFETDSNGEEKLYVNIKNNGANLGEGMVYDGVQTYQGLIYADPGMFQNETIVTDKTYQPTQMNGTAFLSYKLGDGSDVKKLTGPFTVTKMVNERTGEEVNSTKLQSSDFSTSDTSDLTKQVEKIIEIRKIVEERNDVEANRGGGPIFSGGGSLFSGLSSSDMIVIGVFLIGGLLVLARLLDSLKPL
ncbi:hypothetical protein ACFQE1_02145 [Halobium palmae]|uniref:Envelope protein N-terminal domain-containing protein n=1 Tax=Halobium palmae TaxID=1776492 RepID=A0ABD5RVI4_9EURY